MSNHKSINPFDTLMDTLIEAFLKIDNIDLVNTDSTGSQIFNTISFRLSDLASFKELVLRHYIPETNKAIIITRKHVSASKYKQLLNIPKEAYNDTLYQTIRLSYVGLFHKFESYVNDVTGMADLLIDNKTTETVEKYAKRKFGFSLKDWQLFWITHKVNWVANCVKHYDGFPHKSPVPVTCEYYPGDRRLEISQEEFKSDSNYLLKVCPAYLQIFFAIAQLKSHEDNFDREFWKDDIEMLRSHEDGVKKVEDIVRAGIQKLKSIAKGEVMTE